jgi:hypothetical protein
MFQNGSRAGESPLGAKAGEIGVRSGTTEAPLGTGMSPKYRKQKTTKSLARAYIKSRQGLGPLSAHTLLMEAWQAYPSLDLALEFPPAE